MFCKFYLIMSILFLHYNSFSQSKDSAFICGIPESSPEYPGGFIALNKYMDSSIHYPDSARNMDIQGRVVLKFLIKKDGTIADVSIFRDIGFGCGEEAKRIVLAMPKWNPGKRNGEPVEVYYTMPVIFKLNE